MSRIPLIPAVVDPVSGPMTGTLTFSGYSPKMHDATTDLRGRISVAAEMYGRNAMVAIMDVKGISQKDADPMVLKKLRSRKMGCWIMTGVTCVDDVFDSFYVGIGGLMVPYHTVRSDAEMREINSISDRIVPIVFTKGADAITVNGHEDVVQAAGRLKAMGYPRVGVIDVSGKSDRPLLGRLHETGGVMPYVSGQSPAIEGMFRDIGFTSYFTDAP